MGAIAWAQGIKPIAFQCNGDLIQGWYWLRDEALQHKAWWTFENLPVTGEGLTLEIACLATSWAGGPRGVSASFRLGYGFPGAGMMGGVFVVQEVTLPNVSPPEDPVGYLCRGTVTIPPDTPGLAVGKLTVFAERIAKDGPHVAFNENSLVIKVFPAELEAGPKEFRTAPPTGFKSNGALIEGSYWCHREGHYLEWQWGPIPTSGQVEEAAINLELLVTNKENGGSGHSVRVIAQILTPEGEGVYVSFVDVRNPFLPVFAGDSKGVGYAAYGALSLPLEIIARQGLFTRGFRLRIAWPGLHSDYHFAGAPAAALLAWIEQH
ncbi:MAG: hypothetical protein ABDI20_05295 [Candidatus Bipolaricaulaceae bacterium]